MIGFVLPALSGLFIASLVFGPQAPGIFRHVGFDLGTVASYAYASTDGIYGPITYVLASQMFLFIIFGAFLLQSGAAKYFSEMSMALLGHRTGGTAKAAVISSTIVGSITGSATANVAVSGSMTIPLMKAAGFRPHVAGGVEAAASTGGTVMPPVMGVAAFVMVAITGIPYSDIVLYSFTPALLYFFFVYVQVHLYASRKGLLGRPKDELPQLWATAKLGLPYVMPIFLIFYMVINGYSLPFTALVGIGGAVVASWFNRKSWMSPKSIVTAMAAGTRQALPIIVIAGPVSMIALALLLPGTGLRVTGMILAVGAGNLELTLALIFAVAYVLGMGLSIVPAYIILATLAAPALIQLGVPTFAAHLLVLWWGQASAITPPVALASYVAASIADAPFWRTGWAAVMKGAGLFVIPVLFVYQPGILYGGTPAENALAIGSVILGMVLLAALIEGFLLRPLSALERVALGGSGIAFLVAHDWRTLAAALVVAAAAAAVALWRTGPRNSAPKEHKTEVISN